MMQNPQIKYTGGLPLGANTVNLFDTTLTAVRNFLALASAGRFEVSIQNSQAGSLKAYWSDDFGVTWNLYNTTAAAIPAAGASTGPGDYDVSGYRDWKLDWVNGGVDQTSFKVNMALIEGARTGTA